VVEIKGQIKMGVCIYHEQNHDGVREFLMTDGILSTRKRSFKAFRWIDHSNLKAALLAHLLQIFQNDPDIRLLEHDR
jgi:hypothetical protein